MTFPRFESWWEPELVWAEAAIALREMVFKEIQKRKRSDAVTKDVIIKAVLIRELSLRWSLPAGMLAN